MPSSSSVTSFVVIALVMLVGCTGSTVHTSGPSQSVPPADATTARASDTENRPAQQPVPASDAEALEAPNAQSRNSPPKAFEPFSGELVYLIQVFEESNPNSVVQSFELHYFISGENWKHTDQDGNLIALYEPATRQIHYFSPVRKAIPASYVDATYEFSTNDETRQILGYDCQSLRKVSDTESSVEFFSEQLRIDQAPFLDHHFRGWSGFLAFTDGAVSLDSETIADGRRVSVKTVAINPRSFEDAFWTLPVAGPATPEATP